MQRGIGQVDMVRWQGRRLAGHTRAKSRLLRAVLWAAALSALSLIVGFYGGLPVPIGLLQSVAVLLVVGAAAYAAWSLILTMLHRGGRDRL